MAYSMTSHNTPKQTSVAPKSTLVRSDIVDRATVAQESCTANPVDGPTYLDLVLTEGDTVTKQ